MFLYFGGVWMSPHICMPPYVCIPLICLYTPRGVHTPPWAPMLFCASAWCWSICMLLGVVMCFYGVLGHLPYTTPVWGYLHINFTPTLSHWFPVHCSSQGYQYLMWAFFPSVEGFGGVPPSLGEVWGHISSSAIHMLILVHFL